IGTRMRRLSGRLLALADDQPVLLVSAELRRNERVRALQTLAVQANGQPAVPLFLQQLVGAVVPDLDRPRAVLALWNLALERAVVERVILDVDGEMLLAGLERDPLRNGPARERAVTLEPEVVV